MNKQELKEKLKANPGYLKSGSKTVARIFGVSRQMAYEVTKEVKEELDQPISRPKTLSTLVKVDLGTKEGLQILKEKDLFEEFLKWKGLVPTTENRSKRVLPKPFLTGNPDNVLVIGDLHEPFCLDGYLEFCRAKQEEFNCGVVIFIGDIIDNHYSSYHESEQDTYGPNEEFDRAKDKVANWYSVFPEAFVCIGNHDRMAARKAKSAGIADRWLKDYSQVLETPGWKFVMEVVINNVCYNHGEGGEAASRMTKELISQVQGHLHAKFYIQYGVGARHRIFGLQTGCGIDRNSFAFAYGKNGPKPVIGCSVVLDKGELPILLPMKLK